MRGLYTAVDRKQCCVLTLLHGLCRRRRRDDSRERSRRREEERRCVTSACPLLGDAVLSIHVQGGGLGREEGRLEAAVVSRLYWQGWPVCWQAELCMLVSTGRRQRRSLSLHRCHVHGSVCAGSALELSGISCALSAGVTSSAARRLSVRSAGQRRGAGRGTGRPGWS